MSPERIGPGSRRAASDLVFVAAFLYLLFVALVFVKITAVDDGHFIYALDDSYIQLSLSEQIAHGHYGINPGEFSSPGSSLLWPFLLAPFAGHAIHVYVPLILNVLFGLIAVVVLSLAVNRWPPHGILAGSRGWWLKLLTVGLLMFVANLVSLPFIGMEHVLQVLLSIACAVGLAFAWDGEEIPRWCLAAAAIAPMVRYEDLSLLLAVSLVLVATQHKVKAALLFAVGILPLAAYGLFLHHRGMPMLPTSVIMRGTSSIGLHKGFLETAYAILRDHYHLILYVDYRWPVLALGIILGFILLAEHNPTRRVILLAGVILAFLQMSIGPFGFFYRYEIYALIFLTLLFYRSVMDPPVKYAAILFALFALASPHIAAAGQAASVTNEIYRQQFQMHRFLVDYYRKDVAVNDLGWTSYRRASGVYVLDLAGLASLEAANAPDRNAPWLEGIVSRHHVGLAILYPDWFQIPPSWTPVGKLCLAEATTQVVGGRCVVFYATSAASEPEIRSDLIRFVPTLPRRVSFEFDPRDELKAPTVELNK